jgi:hypothetical protein
MKDLQLNVIADLSDEQRADLATRGVRTVGELYALLVMPLVGEPLRRFLKLDLNEALALRHTLEECLTEKERRELILSFRMGKRLGALFEMSCPPRKGL